MNVRLLLAALALFAASALALRADEDDPIAAQLLKDKEAFVKAQGKAKENVLKAFDKHYETVKNNTALKIEVQLAQLEKIEAEKKAFDENGVPPTLTGLKVAMSEYRAAQKKDELACKAAFEKAAKAYRDKGDVKLAAATLEEMKEFLAKAPGATTGTGGAAAAAPSVIPNAVAGKILGLQNGKTDEGTKIMTADYVKGDQTQLWKVVPAADGWVYIENIKSGLVMTANGKGNGTEVIISKKATPANENQLWKITPVMGVKDAVKVFAKPSGRLIGVDAKSKNAGARILLWDEQGNEPAQIFAFTPPK
jgi:hypothetical protein